MCLTSISNVLFNIFLKDIVKLVRLKVNNLFQLPRVIEIVLVYQKKKSILI
jgi:hypothetical protein